MSSVEEGVRDPPEHEETGLPIQLQTIERRQHDWRRERETPRGIVDLLILFREFLTSESSNRALGGSSFVARPMLSP